MWRYDGREFEAPRFQFGFAPAANLYATMPDLARFMQMLMWRGDGIVRARTLDQMWTPQFTDEEAGYGLGFYVDRFEGHRRVRHSGAVYGFATDFNVLPEEKIGVCASASMDVSNAVVRRISEYALRLLLAARRGKPLPSLPLSRPVERSLARRLDGRYQNERRKVELHEREGRLFLEMEDALVELRSMGSDLIVDDRHRYGTRVSHGEGSIRVAGEEFRRVERPKPPPPPVHWSSLVGEYGWDHNTLYIYEKYGALHALIEWTEIDPLREVQQDLFAFPDFGMYHGELLRFHRDGNGRVTKVVAASVEFERKTVGTAEGTTFTITPIRQVSRLRREALAANPPGAEAGQLEPELVEITRLDPTIRLDIRYASTNNFMQAVFYREPRAFLQRPAAEALVRVHRRLSDRGYGILVHDAYRPWYVTKMFWDATPEEFKIFVANPETGSIHNRGAAVDITLVDRRTGLPVRMPSGYDEFSDRAFADYPGGTDRQRWFRSLLRKAMEEEGFSVYPWEWWHFNYEEADRYPIMNATFDKIRLPLERN
jgi:D-alanyl-D-alanine dipeptidase